ncbi:MAG: malate dehydrogenase [Acidimicrobiales bacterium]|nr:malate dehydrogenase [Actinomycetota bacterium]
MKITVVGAGFYGSTLAQRIAEADYATQVVLTDVVEGKPQGLALDLMQSRAIAGFHTEVVGSNDYGPAAGSTVAVITAGVPRKPGMSRMDLLETNARIVIDVTRRLLEVAPDAVLIVVTNPLDEMTALAAEVSGLHRSRVMGQAGVLDTARFRHFLAERAGVDPEEVKALTLGSHGETMVPVPSLAWVGGKRLDDVLDAAAVAEVVVRTRDAGAEIVGLLKTGSAYFAPAAAAEAMVRAVVTESADVLPVSAWLGGEYGIRGVYLGVPARLGPEGVEEIVELPLAEAELAALRAAAEAVRVKQAEAVGLARP